MLPDMGVQVRTGGGWNLSCSLPCGPGCHLFLCSPDERDTRALQGEGERVPRPALPTGPHVRGSIWDLIDGEGLEGSLPPVTALWVYPFALGFSCRPVSPSLPGSELVGASGSPLNVPGTPGFPCIQAKEGGRELAWDWSLHFSSDQ